MDINYLNSLDLPQTAISIFFFSIIAALLLNEILGRKKSVFAKSLIDKTLSLILVGVWLVSLSFWLHSEGYVDISNQYDSSVPKYANIHQTATEIVLPDWVNKAIENLKQKKNNL